jgi:hypothetical protein
VEPLHPPYNPLIKDHRCSPILHAAVLSRSAPSRCPKPSPDRSASKPQPLCCEPTAKSSRAAIPDVWNGPGYPSGCPGLYNACVVGRVVLARPGWTTRPSLCALLCVARGLGWCDHGYPRWDAHTTESMSTIPPCSAHRLLFWGRSSYIPHCTGLRPFFLLYSRECVEVEFSEVRCA